MSNAQRKHINPEPRGINSISRYKKPLRFSSRQNQEPADFIERQFQTYFKKWAEETAFLSSTGQIKGNENYQNLVKLGKIIIPFILKEIIKGSSNVRWSILLCDIVGYNPVPSQFYGNFDLMHGYWVKWGEEQGYLV